MIKACPQVGPCRAYQSPQALSSLSIKIGFLKPRNKKANTMKEMTVRDHITRIKKKKKVYEKKRNKKCERTCQG